MPRSFDSSLQSTPMPRGSTSAERKGGKGEEEREKNRKLEEIYSCQTMTKANDITRSYLLPRCISTGSFGLVAAKLLAVKVALQ